MPSFDTEIKSKLQRFESTIMEEVSQRCREINAELEAYRESELERYKDDVLNESYNIIHKKTLEISQDSMKEVSRRRADVKRKLFERRDEYTRLVFADARVSLSGFTKTAEYLPFLLEKVKNLGAEYGSEGFVLFVREDDLASAAEIKKAFGFECTVSASPQVVLGGVLAKNTVNGYVIDESLDTILLSQHEWFSAQPDLVVSL